MIELLIVCDHNCLSRIMLSVFVYYSPTITKRNGNEYSVYFANVSDGITELLAEYDTVRILFEGN